MQCRRARWVAGDCGMEDPRACLASADREGKPCRWAPGRQGGFLMPDGSWPVRLPMEGRRGEVVGLEAGGGVAAADAAGGL